MEGNFETHEKDLTNYEKLTNFNQYDNYMINIEKGTMINKKNKYIGYRSPRGGSFQVALKSSIDDNYYIMSLDHLIWYQVHPKYDQHKYKLCHIDNSQYNNAISNLKLIEKGYIKIKSKINVIITNRKTKEETVYDSVLDAVHETGISRFIITQALKSDDKTKKIKDKKGNKYKITVEIEPRLVVADN